MNVILCQCRRKNCSSPKYAKNKIQKSICVGRFVFRRQNIRPINSRSISCILFGLSHPLTVEIVTNWNSKINTIAKTPIEPLIMCTFHAVYENQKKHFPNSLIVCQFSSHLFHRIKCVFCFFFCFLGLLKSGWTPTNPNSQSLSASRLPLFNIIVFASTFAFMNWKIYTIFIDWAH